MTTAGHPRKCKSCEMQKPIADFGKHKATKDGIRLRCKQCVNEESRKWREENQEKYAEIKRRHAVNNREKILQYKRKRYSENRDKIKAESLRHYYENKEAAKQRQREWRAKNSEYNRERCRKWREDFPEKNREAYRAYKQNNHSKVLAWNAERRARKLMAVPPWADRGKINEIYNSCPKGCHVDHIIPLKGDMVCGLHTDQNLQILSASDNIAKSNRLIEGY